MEFKILAVLVVIVSACQAKEVNLGLSSTSCGGTPVLVAKNEMVTVYSTGSAPNGYCSVLLNAINDYSESCPYKAFCVTVTKNTISADTAKVFLSGTSFDVTGISTKEISSYSAVYGSWCTQSQSLEISVLENPKQSGGSYAFNMTVKSECRSQPTIEFDQENSNSKKIEEIENEINQNRIVGVVVGVCLACMFLVILFISYNYYKNKPTYRQQRDN